MRVYGERKLIDLYQVSKILIRGTNDRKHYLGVRRWRGDHINTRTEIALYIGYQYDSISIWQYSAQYQEVFRFSSTLVKSM